MTTAPRSAASIPTPPTGSSTWRPWNVNAPRHGRPRLLRLRSHPTPTAGTGWKVLALFAVLATIVVSVLAFVSYERGMTWRDLALQQQARGQALELRIEEATRVVRESDTAVERAQETLAAAEAAREAANGQLGTSEGDVAALEERVVALAGEKARLEDELAVAGEAVQADVHSNAALRQCVAAIRAWLERSPVDGQSASWALWADEAAGWESTCDAAGS